MRLSFVSHSPLAGAAPGHMVLLCPLIHFIRLFVHCSFNCASACYLLKCQQPHVEAARLQRGGQQFLKVLFFSAHVFLLWLLLYVCFLFSSLYFIVLEIKLNLSAGACLVACLPVHVQCSVLLNTTSIFSVFRAVPLAVTQLFTCAMACADAGSSGVCTVKTSGCDEETSTPTAAWRLHDWRRAKRN